MFISINNGTLPKRKTKYSAGYDVCSNENVIIKAGETRLVSLGIALDQTWIQKNTDETFRKQNYLGLYIRSSLALKGLMLGNSVGIIDIDYPDEIKMIIHNSSKTEKKILQNDRIGQLIFHQHNGINILDTLYSDEIERNGGFGSTNS
jgi:dUTP pyrophosphatase